MMNLNLNELLVRIKNGLLKKKKHILVPYSYTNLRLLKSLTKDGFVHGYEKISGEKQKTGLYVLLKYDINHNPAITELKLVSKVERKQNFRKNSMNYNKNGFSLSYFSSSKGIQSSNSGECLFVIK